MRFQVFTEMAYDIRAESTVLYNIHALDTAHQQVIAESFTVTPFLEAVELHSNGVENRFFRVSIPEPGSITVRYNAEVQNSCVQVELVSDDEISVSRLDASILPYLYPSRYCQSDKLYRFAQHNFGQIKGSFAKATAVTNWIFTNVKYTGRFTTSQTSAYDTVTELVGVCRDFAHLGIALCRALSIPARYFTAYAIDLRPGDIHACFEAYLFDQWVLFDPTFLVPLNGMVKIGTGRDAADASIATMFGDMNFKSMKVDCKIVDAEFLPLPAGCLVNAMVIYS